jgi:hypothetical protein
LLAFLIVKKDTEKMTARTDPDPRHAVRHLIADALLVTANAAVKNGATPDEASVALLATAVNFSLDVVKPQQLVRELRRLADEVAELPVCTDKRTEKPN